MTEAQPAAEFGIVANVAEADKILRMGAKAWILGGWADGGFERVTVIAASRGGRQVEKFTPIARLTNFRCAWAPPAIRERLVYFVGTRPDMEARAATLQEVADRQRAAHPNRRSQIAGEGKANG